MTHAVGVILSQSAKDLLPQRQGRFLMRAQCSAFCYCLSLLGDGTLPKYDGKILHCVQDDRVLGVQSRRGNDPRKWVSS